MMIARLRSDPTRLRTADSTLPEAMERVLLEAMSRDADSRYPTATEFARALADAAQGRRTNSGILGRLFGR